MKEDLVELLREVPPIFAGMYMHKEGTIPCDGRLLHEVADAIERLERENLAYAIRVENDAIRMRHIKTVLNKELERTRQLMGKLIKERDAARTGIGPVHSMEAAMSDVRKLIARLTAADKQVARLTVERDAAIAERAALQAAVDSLMLEFCPDEMEEKQIASYEDFMTQENRDE